MEKVYAGEVMDAVARVRSGNGSVRTNMYSALDDTAEYDLTTSSNCAVWSYLDGFVRRVYFVSTDDVSLQNMLSAMPSKSFLEIISKSPTDGQLLLEKAGFSKYSCFERVSCSDIADRLTDNISPELLKATDARLGHSAAPEDAPRILALLQSVFDSTTSHLATIERLRKQIEAGEVWVAEDDEGICSLLIYARQGKRFYVNQIYNRAHKTVIHSLMLTCLAREIEQGVTYAYAWIDVENARSLAFHERYSMRPDGLYCTGYMKGKVNG